MGVRTILAVSLQSYACMSRIGTPLISSGRASRMPLQKMRKKERRKERKKERKNVEERFQKRVEGFKI
jgi:hypothetical protein